MRLGLPDYFTHLFRDRNTRLVHCVVTSKSEFKRRPDTRAICGIAVSREAMWRRPPMGTPDEIGITCGACVDAHTAMDDLMESGV